MLVAEPITPVPALFTVPVQAPSRRRVHWTPAQPPGKGA
jgi:hypothetical protein